MFGNNKASENHSHPHWKQANFPNVESPSSPPLNMRLEFSWLDFSSTANPLGTPSSVMEAIHDSLAGGHQIYTPDHGAHSIRTILARTFSLFPENFLVGSSISSMIQAVAQSFEPCTVGVSTPSPGSYALAVSNAGHQVVDLTNLSSFMAPEPELVRMYGMSFDAAVLSNPSYPTSRLLPKSILVQYLESCEWVIVDERSIELTLGGESYTPLIAEYPNLIIVRSLSDTFALPGIPISYCIGSREMIAQILKHYDPSSISMFPEVVCDALAQQGEYLDRARDLLEIEIPWMQCMLNLIPGINIFPAESNYVLCEFINDGSMRLSIKDTQELADKLQLAGFLIRRIEGTPGLSDNRYFCVSVRTRPENEKLIEAMRNIILSK